MQTTLINDYVWVFFVFFCQAQNCGAFSFFSSSWLVLISLPLSLLFLLSLCSIPHLSPFHLPPSSFLLLPLLFPRLSLSLFFYFFSLCFFFPFFSFLFFSSLFLSFSSFFFDFFLFLSSSSFLPPFTFLLLFLSSLILLPSHSFFLPFSPLLLAFFLAPLDRHNLLHPFLYLSSPPPSLFF